MRHYPLLGLIYGLCTIAALLLATAPLSAIADEQPANQPIYTIEISDDIKAGTALDFERAINQAEQANASHLVIQLDTPGGLLQSTRTIVEAVSGSDVPVVVYVHQPGGWAFSAGTIILLSAEQAYVHPGASIGAAQPFSPNGGNEVQDEKVMQGTITWVRSLAEQHDRDPAVAERFVSENLTLTGTEALEQGVIDGTVDSFEKLLDQLGAAEAEVITLERTITGSVLNILSDPFLVSLFITLGSLGLLLAIRTGEFEFSGAIGVVLLLIGLWGTGVIEFTVLGIGLLVLGAILVMIELFDQPGFGLFGAGGLIAIVAGVFTLNEEPFYNPQLISVAGLLTISTLLLALVAFGFISRSLARSIKSAPVTGEASLIGKEAVALNGLSPRGRVRVDTESWQAVLAEGEKPIKKGGIACIMGVKGNTLIVKRRKDK